MSFVPGQDSGETFGLFGTDGVDGMLQVFLEHVLVEEQQPRLDLPFLMC